jgi:hypothetical protein
MPPFFTRAGLALVGLVCWSAGCSRGPAPVPCPDARLPVHDELAWDPNAPLILAFTYGDLAHDAAGLMSRTSLRDADGAELPLVGATRGSVVYLCPVGGLAPQRTYVWELREVGAESVNSVSVPPFPYTGLSVFRTAATSVREPVTHEAGCRKAARSEQTACYADLIPVDDTGDTGTGDTGDTETGLAPVTSTVAP